jgi:hypothetical protein
MLIFYFSQATRQPETEHLLGGWVAPVGSNPTAMLLQHAGADDESRRPIPANAMIVAGEPSTQTIPRLRLRCSRVKNMITRNSLVTMSLSLEGVRCRRKEEPAKPADRTPEGERHTLELKSKGHETRETGWTTRGKFGATSRSSAEAPAGCLTPHQTKQCRNRTWTPSRALGPHGPSRTWAACARQAGSQPSKCPGQRLGYAKFGIATLEASELKNP